MRLTNGPERPVGAQLHGQRLPRRQMGAEHPAEEGDGDGEAGAGEGGDGSGGERAEGETGEGGGVGGEVGERVAQRVDVVEVEAPAAAAEAVQVQAPAVGERPAAARELAALDAGEVDAGAERGEVDGAGGHEQLGEPAAQGGGAVEGVEQLEEGGGGHRQCSMWKTTSPRLAAVPTLTRMSPARATGRAESGVGFS